MTRQTHPEEERAHHRHHEPSSQETSSSSPWGADETLERLRGYLPRLFDALGLSPPPLVAPEDLRRPLLNTTTETTQARRRLQQQLHLQDQHIAQQKDTPKITRQKQRAALQVLGESSLRLLDVALHTPQRQLRPSEHFRTLCAQRPTARLEFDQLFCSPDSTERRVTRILQELPPEGRVLLLGDDDLTSLGLSLHHEGPLDVVEFDPRLLDFLRARIPAMQDHAIDLFLGGLPLPMEGRFDAVVLDPPWDDYHAWCFLHKACLALKRAPHARIYMAFCPLNVAWLERKAIPFWRRFAQVGLAVEAIEPALHLYPLQGTEFMQLLLESSPPAQDSALLQSLQTLPFGFSDLYVLRHIQNFRMPPWRRWLQRWWHLET